MRKSNTYPLIIILFIFNLLVTNAQNIANQELFSKETQKHALFGWDMCATDDWVFVASPNYNVDGVKNAGIVEVYKYNDSELEHLQTLTSDFPSVHENFGFSVAAYGDYIVIGAIGNNSKGILAGCAYVYENKSGVWSLEQKLYPDNNETGSLFGHDVDISSGHILVGAPKGKGDEEFAGCAYLYTNENGNWLMHKKIKETAGKKNSRFGWKVCLGEHAYISAINYTKNNIKSGAVFGFELGEATNIYPSFEILPSNSENAACFGAALDFDNGYLIIGAHKGSRNGFNNGYVDIYKIDGTEYVIHQELESPDLTTNAFFGNHIKIKNNDLYIGETKAENDSQKEAGVIHKYTLTDNLFDFETTIALSSPAKQGYFGWSICISEQGIFVGEKGNDDLARDAGKVHYFDSGLVGMQIPMLDKSQDDTSPEFYPNPWKENLNISFSLIEQSRVTIKIYDIKGSLIKIMNYDNLPATTHNIVWNGKDDSGHQVIPGAYMATIKINNNITMKRSVRLK